MIGLKMPGALSQRREITKGGAGLEGQGLDGVTTALWVCARRIKVTELSVLFWAADAVSRRLY